MKQKRNILITGLAVTLAAATLLGGATYAYLRSETDDVVNTFNANQVTVSLAETTGASYDIIPGTVQQKDPTVTVNNTVDAYAFVEVTDKTEGLVTYTMADGWQLLEGYDNIYYRAVAADAADKTFAVLQNNQVSYDAALANSDMVENGVLKTDLALTFKASAMQSKPFASAQEAYLAIPVLAHTGEEFQTALGTIKEGQTIQLEEDVAIEYNGTHPSGVANSYIAVPNCTIDLNGKNITVTNRSGIPFGLAADGITLKNGSLTITSEDSDYPLFVTSGAKNVVIDGVTIFGGMQVIGNSQATLRNVTITANNYYDVYLEYNSTVTIESGTFIRKDTKPHVYTALASDKVIVKGGTFDGADMPEHAGRGTLLDQR